MPEKFMIAKSAAPATSATASAIVRAVAPRSPTRRTRVDARDGTSTVPTLYTRHPSGGRVEIGSDAVTGWWAMANLVALSVGTRLGSLGSAPNGET
jgi:hypothetical protein